MLTNNQIKSLHQVKHILDMHNYSTYMSFTVGDGVYYNNPLPDYNSTLIAIKRLPRYIQSLFKFFALGLPIKKSELAIFFNAKVIEDLKCLDVLNYDTEDIWLNNIVMVSYLNCYMFVGNVYYYPTCQSKEQIPYIGPDSYWLSKMICNHVSGDVLDLCSGSGIQAILAAKTSRRVVAVDIDTQAIHMLSINVCLNDLENKVEIRQGDLLKVIEDNELFDYITANPPFIPIPDTIQFPLAGDGGSLGDSVISQIIAEGWKHLQPNGELIMIGQTIGNAKQPYLSNLTQKYICDGTVNLTYRSKTLLDHQSIELAKLSNIINNTNVDNSEWLKNYDKVGATYFYSFLFKAIKNNVCVLNEHFFDDTWFDSDIPILKSSWKKAYDSYVVSHNGKHNIIVEEEVIEFLKRTNGNQSLSEIVESMPFKYKVRYGNDSSAKMTAKYMTLCSFLEHNNIISKKEPS